MKYSNNLFSVYRLVDLSAVGPRPRFCWRPVPRILRPLIIAYAAFLWAFGSYVQVRVQSVTLGTDYIGFIIRIFETGGRWYIKLGS